VKNSKTKKRAAFSHSTVEQQPEPKKLFEDTIEKLRKKIEIADRLTTVVATHSLGGGTGSGMTSAVLQVR